MESTETPPPNYSQEEFFRLKQETKSNFCAEYVEIAKRGATPNRSVLREKHTIKGTNYPAKTTVNQWINKLPKIEPVWSDGASDLWYLFTRVKYTYPSGSSSSPLPMYPESPEEEEEEEGLFKHI